MKLPTERIIGGISCREVLSVLSDFLDGELDNATRESVVAHVSGCDVCERFGGEFTRMIEAVRRRLREPADLEADVESRLKKRISGS